MAAKWRTCGGERWEGDPRTAQVGEHTALVLIGPLLLRLPADATLVDRVSRFAAARLTPLVLATGPLMQLVDAKQQASKHPQGAQHPGDVRWPLSGDWKLRARRPS